MCDQALKFERNKHL